MPPLYQSFVLRLIPQKESDAMITCLGPKGFFSFYARGVRKATSPMLSSCMEGSLSDFVLAESATGSLTLKEASLKKSYLSSDNYEAVSAVSSLFELTALVVAKEEGEIAYPRLLATLEAISKGHDPYSLLFLYLAFVLKIEGLGLEVDRCALCGEKHNIVCFNTEAGGFVCAECFDPVFMEKTDPMLLKMYRFAFRCEDKDIERVSFEKRFLLPALSTLNLYLEEATGIKAKGIAQILRF